MGDDFGKIVMPVMIGAAMGWAGGKFLPDLFLGEMIKTPLMSAVVGGLGSGAMAMMTPQQPQMPDYSSQFGQQQQQLTQEQSFGRRGTADLENTLLNGSEQDKNMAFYELQRRGEDETKLREMSGRSTRSESDQADLDEFVEKNAPPDASEIELMAAQLQAERESGFAKDLEAERTRLKQISATRGTLDSNRNREMNLRLAEIAAANRAELGSKARAEAVAFQSGIQDIQKSGFDRMLQGAGYAETQNRYNIELSEAERRYQESLRGAKTEDQRNLAFSKFQADLDRQLAVYNNEAASARSRAMQQSGLAAIPLRAAFQQTSTDPVSSNLGFLNPNTSYSDQMKAKVFGDGNNNELI